MNLCQTPEKQNLQNPQYLTAY
ncbi:hypothetical protein, partial [Flammeovirga pacifica]